VPCRVPAEVSLAHNGVLFLDELPEFPRNVLEVMRQPLEDGTVCIARASMSLTFPARFMLAAAMNPCPCGYFNDRSRDCHCTQPMIQRYMAKYPDAGRLTYIRLQRTITRAGKRAAEISASAASTSPRKVVRVNMQIALQQRRNFCHVALDHRLSAMAIARAVVEISAGTRVHRRCQHESRRKSQRH